MRIFDAKYRGHCDRCRGEIRRGEQVVEPFKGARRVHVKCVDAAAAAAGSPDALALLAAALMPHLEPLLRCSCTPPKRKGQLMPDRLERARAIAHELATFERDDPTVLASEVRDVFVDRYGIEAWYDQNGRAFWAGAIFKNGEWQAVGWTTSPYNHNRSRVWRLRKQ